MNDEDEHRGEPVWSPGNPSQERAWRIAGLFAWVVALVAALAARITQHDGNIAWIFLAVALLMAFVFRPVAARRQRRHAATPQVSGPELARYKGSIGWGQQAMAVWVVLDDHALHLLGRGNTPVNAVIALKDLACAQPVHLTPQISSRGRNQVFVVSRDGSSRLIRVPDAHGLLDILAAHGVAIHEEARVNAFAMGFGRAGGLDVALHDACRRLDVNPTGHEVVERRALPLPPARPRRSRKKVAGAIVGAVVLLGAVFVVLAVVIDANDPNQPASAADVASWKARTRRAFDHWRLPPSVVHTPSDRTSAYGYGGIKSARHFAPAPGFTAQQAAEDLVASLREQGYSLRDNFPTAHNTGWYAEPCGLRDAPDCGLYIDVMGNDPQRIDADFEF